MVTSSHNCCHFNNNNYKPESDSSHRPLLFDESNYTYWSTKMGYHIRSIDLDLGDIIIEGDKIPKKKRRILMANRSWRRKKNPLLLIRLNINLTIRLWPFYIARWTRWSSIGSLLAKWQRQYGISFRWLMKELRKWKKWGSIHWSKNTSSSR